MQVKLPTVNGKIRNALFELFYRKPALLFNSDSLLRMYRLAEQNIGENRKWSCLDCTKRPDILKKELLGLLGRRTF